MAETTQMVEHLDAATWAAVEAYAHTHNIAIGAIVTEALHRYLEDLADVAVADASRGEGGRIPYDLGGKLLLSTTEEEANRAQRAIDACRDASPS